MHWPLQKQITKVIILVIKTGQSHGTKSRMRDVGCMMFQVGLPVSEDSVAGPSCAWMVLLTWGKWKGWTVILLHSPCNLSITYYFSLFGHLREEYHSHRTDVPAWPRTLLAGSTAHSSGWKFIPSIKQLSWMTPEAKPVHAITKWKKNVKLYIGWYRYSPKNMINVYLVIYSDLKLHRKLQKVNEAIYFFIVESAGQ